MFVIKTKEVKECSEKASQLIEAIQGVTKLAIENKTDIEKMKFIISGIMIAIAFTQLYMFIKLRRGTE